MVDVDDVIGIIVNGNLKSYAIAKLIGKISNNDIDVVNTKQFNGITIPEFTISVSHKFNHFFTTNIKLYKVNIAPRLSKWQTSDSEFYKDYNTLAKTTYNVSNIDKIFWSHNLTLTHAIALAVLSKYNNIPSVFFFNEPSRPGDIMKIYYTVGYDFSFDKNSNDTVNVKMKFEHKGIS